MVSPAAPGALAKALGYGQTAQQKMHSMLLVKEVTATASQRWRRIYLRHAFVRDAVAQAPCIILNADVVSGPAPSPPCLFNERAAPLSRGEQVASARKFVARVASELPSALLSLGSYAALNATAARRAQRSAYARWDEERRAERAAQALPGRHRRAPAKA